MPRWAVIIDEKAAAPAPSADHGRIEAFLRGLEREELAVVIAVAIGRREREQLLQSLEIDANQLLALLSSIEGKARKEFGDGVWVIRTRWAGDSDVYELDPNVAATLGL